MDQGKTTYSSGTITLAPLACYCISGTNEPALQEWLNQMHGRRRSYGIRGRLPSNLWGVLLYVSGAPCGIEVSPLPKKTHRFFGMSMKERQKRDQIPSKK